MISRKASLKHYVLISLFLAISIAVASVASPIANWLMGDQDLWGSATDGKRIYAAISNINNTPWILQGGGPFAGQEVSHGFWSALDGATGTLLWQSADPNIAMDTGALTVANGVLFAGSMGSTRRAASEDTMFSLNSKTGEILWRYPSGGQSIPARRSLMGLYWERATIF
jgi:polyvinyl alcohol dehydrogenase (cytochrome)